MEEEEEAFSALAPADDERDALYRSLGLARTARDTDVASAYRRLARLYHPDRHPGADREHAARRWTEISGAHDVLADPRRRFLYDHHGAAAVSPNAPGGQTAVGAALKSPEELRALFARQQQREWAAAREARLRASATSVLSLSIADPLDTLLDPRKRRAAARAAARSAEATNGWCGTGLVGAWLELLRPELQSAAGSTSMRLRLSRAPDATAPPPAAAPAGGAAGGAAPGGGKREKATELSIDTSFVQRNGLGASTLSLGVQRALSAHASAGVGCQLGPRPSAHAHASRRVSSHATLALSARAAAGGGALAELRASRALGSRRTCELAVGAGGSARAGSAGLATSSVGVKVGGKGRGAADPMARARARAAWAEASTAWAEAAANAAANAAQAAHGRAAARGGDGGGGGGGGGDDDGGRGGGGRAGSASAPSAAEASSLALRELLPALPSGATHALRVLLLCARELARPARGAHDDGAHDDGADGGADGGDARAARAGARKSGVFRLLRQRASAHVVSWSLEARASGLDIECGWKLCWRHSAMTKTRISSSLSVASGLSASAHVERVISAGSRSALGCTLQCGRSGAHIKVRAERGGFRILLPVYLGSARGGTSAAALAWAVASGAVRWLVVERSRRRRRARRRRARIAEAANATMEAEASAAAEARIRGAEARKSASDEEDYDGLLIDVALYGLLPHMAASPSTPSPFYDELCRCLAPASARSAPAESPPARPRHERRAQLLRARGLVDVTVVLQSLVERGHLALPAGAKAGLPAFYRPRLCAAHAISADGQAASVREPLPSLGEDFPPLDQLAIGAEDGGDGDAGGGARGGAGAASARGGVASVELIPADAPLRLFVAYRLRGETRRLVLEDDQPLALGDA